MASCTESAFARGQAKAPRRIKPVRTPLDIEQPLRDATLTVEALRLVGHGLCSHDHVGGDAVAELARIAAERLEVVEERWNKVLEARRRGRS
jgi:hypothetical protein